MILQTSYTGPLEENSWYIVTRMRKYWMGSEEITTYRSPVDNRVHRCFPHFYIKVQENTGRIKTC